MTFDRKRFRRLLLAWFDSNRRDLPWRRTRDPYAIWVSEIMLQQTRVAAVIPYYERFLCRFPDVGALAVSAEEELLSYWAGLGYYSRARNLHRAAREIVALGGVPRTFEDWLKLPGVGEYTAAAVASIAFDQPHPAIDGNLLRVIARVANDPSDIAAPITKQRFTELASEWMDRSRPGDFNQAMMELGATVCTPKNPSCGKCPVRNQCGAADAGRTAELPVKSRKQRVERHEIVYAIVRRGRYGILLRKRAGDASILPGFWELPEERELPPLLERTEVGEFRHTITHHLYLCQAVSGRLPRSMPSKDLQWKDLRFIEEIPLATAAKKALQCLVI